MIENIQQMRMRHEKEITKLQLECKHVNVSDWMPHYWAPGHRGSDVKVCEFCGKIIEVYKDTFEKFKDRNMHLSKKDLDNIEKQFKDFDKGA
jgi:hypothetical protein